MLDGCFRIVCERGFSGHTQIARQEMRAPMHLSKPYWDGHHLVVNAVNSTAGIFAGDRVAVEVDVARGASVALTTPSASRVHKSRGGEGVLTQEFRVASGGTFLSFPELFIPQAGCRYSQSAMIDVAAGGTLVYAEISAPGRTARGEIFAFDEVRWETRLMHDTRCVALERYSLTQSSPILGVLRERYATPYWGSVFVVSPNETGVVEAMRLARVAGDEGGGDGKGGGVLVGASMLGPGAGVVRVLCGDSIGLRKAVIGCWEKVIRTLGVEVPELRKL